MKELRASLEQLQRQAADERDEMKRLGQAEGAATHQSELEAQREQIAAGRRELEELEVENEELSAALAAQSTKLLTSEDRRRESDDRIARLIA